MSDFEKLKEQLPSEENFYCLLTCKKTKGWSKFEIKKMKHYHDLYLKCDVLQLPVFLKNLEIIA